MMKSLRWSKVVFGCGRPTFLAAGSLQHQTLTTPMRTVADIASSFKHQRFFSSSNQTPSGDASEESSQGMAELRKARLGKIEAMTAEGMNPYSYTYQVTTNAVNLKEKYITLENGCEHTDTVSIAGRIMMRRFFGKLAFFEMQDQSGSIQLYVDKKKLGSEFKKLKDWTDSGDIIGVTGTLKRTEKGELSIFVTSWNMLTKALHPLPDKYHGLTDIKKRYAHRSVDMIVNPEVRNTLYLRSVIIKSIRR